MTESEDGFAEPHTDPSRLPAAGTPESIVEAGRANVTAALAEIDAVSSHPPADQVAAFTTAQQTLQATLAGIDDN